MINKNIVNAKVYQIKVEVLKLGIFFMFVLLLGMRRFDMIILGFL